MLKIYYPDTKSDLSMVMYQKAIDSYSKQDGFIFVYYNNFLDVFEKL